MHSNRRRSRNVERIKKTYRYGPLRVISLALILACTFFLTPLYAEDDRDEVHIDADSVVYQENTGIATADGNVKVRSKTMRLFAPHVEYNSNSQLVEAFSDERGKVDLFSGPDRLTGEHLTYSLETRRGVLTDASGKMEALFMKGNDVRVMPMEDAVKFGVLKSRPKKKKTDAEDEQITEWLNVTTTTCDFEKPHYRLKSKKVVIIPNKKMIIRRPRVYIGEKCIFTYPFDYVARLGPREQSLLPYFAYDSNKGMGGGLKGYVDLGTVGELKVNAIYWSDNMWEARLRYSRDILLEGLSVFLESDRLYDSDSEEIMWRPKWGLEYNAPNGWRAVLYQAQRELIETEMRPGVEQRFNVWTDPEFGIYSPWYGDASDWGRIRFFGIYGRYQDNLATVQPWRERILFGAEMTGSPDVGNFFFKPFYGARYVYHTYEGGDQTQDLIDGWLGVSWKIGDFSFSSMYFRRWADGSSPLAWDRYADNENFYQTVSFPLPFGASWEKWTFSVTAAYDNISREIASMYYSVNYNKHCTTWHLWISDNKAGDEIKAGLFFYINAYPDIKIGIQSETNSEATKKSF